MTILDSSLQGNTYDYDAYVAGSKEFREAEMCTRLQLRCK